MKLLIFLIAVIKSSSVVAFLEFENYEALTEYINENCMRFDVEEGKIRQELLNRVHNKKVESFLLFILKLQDTCYDELRFKSLCLHFFTNSVYKNISISENLLDFIEDYAKFPCQRLCFNKKDDGGIVILKRVSCCDYEREQNSRTSIFSRCILCNMAPLRGLTSYIPFL